MSTLGVPSNLTAASASQMAISAAGSNTRLLRLRCTNGQAVPMWYFLYLLPVGQIPSDALSGAASPPIVLGPIAASQNGTFDLGPTGIASQTGMCVCSSTTPGPRTTPASNLDSFDAWTTVLS